MRRGAITAPSPQALFARSARKTPGPFRSSGGSPTEMTDWRIMLRLACWLAVEPWVSRGQDEPRYQ
eukprot:9353024-Pyramimonas_sp.AAC.1